eukprot:704138-Amphidinium_carterae.1
MDVQPPQEDDEGDGEDEPMEPDDEVLESSSLGDDHREDVLQCRALAERALRADDAVEGVRLLEKAMRLGGEDCPGLSDLYKSAMQQLQQSSTVGASVSASETASQESDGRQQHGGIVDDRYCWSQTKETVEIHVFVPDSTKAKEVCVKTEETRVRITASGKPIFEGEWEYKVAPEEDPDWELTQIHGRKALRLLVRKASMP